MLNFMFLEIFLKQPAKQFIAARQHIRFGVFLGSRRGTAWW